MLVHRRCWCFDIVQTSHLSICIFLNRGWNHGWRSQWKALQKGCGKLRCQMSQNWWINPGEPPRNPASLSLQRCNVIIRYHSYFKLPIAAVLLQIAVANYCYKITLQHSEPHNAITEKQSFLHCVEPKLSLLRVSTGRTRTPSHSNLCLCAK